MTRLSWGRKILRASWGRAFLALCIASLASELFHLFPWQRPWPGLVTLASMLVCAWWGGIRTAVCLPPLLLVLSRIHAEESRDSIWPTPQEGIAISFMTVILVAVGLAGEFRRKIVTIRVEHRQKLKDQARALSKAHIIFRDMEWKVTEWSEGAADMFGWEAKQAVGRDVRELLHTTFSEPWETLDEELLGNGQWQGEVLEQRRDGTTLNISLHWILYRNSEDDPIGVAEVRNDITVLRRTEAAIRVADRRKDEFLATLAHELRNPLAPIRSALELMNMSRELPAHLQETRNAMEEQLCHLIRLVDDLLDVSRITHGKIELRRKAVDLGQLLAKSVDSLREQIRSRGLDLRISIPSQQIPVEADPVRMRQVILNLVGNAIKYTEPGGTIWISADHRGQEVEVSFRDSGMGIPAEKLDEIFEMFGQVDRGLTRTSGGLGIGLTLARQLVQMHGGTLEVCSAGTGHGSTFTMRLASSTVSAPQASGPDNPDESTQEIPRHQVLVVDDTRAAGFMLSKLLEALGQDVQYAENGAAALEMVASTRPNIIFSDIAMPHMDGYELAQRVRQDETLRETVLVAVTGFGQKEDLERAIAAGFTHHLVKPASLSAIRTVLQSLSKSQLVF